MDCMFENLLSHELYGIFDFAAITLIGIGVFLCWRNRGSRFTKTKATGAAVEQSKADDTAPKDIDS